MSDELFQIPVSKSPRILWLEKHQLTILTDHGIIPFVCGVSNEIGPRTGIGATDDEAITDWARKNGVLLWNEEPV